MIDEQTIEKFIVDALAEDVGSGDHTSNACIAPDSISTARLLVKDVGVIAGVELSKRIFQHVDPEAKIDIRIQDGADVDMGNEVFFVTGNTRALLKAERLVLNTMQRMSGIATLSSRFAVEIEGLPVQILDTRKTTPLIRFMEKWAVKIGGCTNYRNGLYDWIMIKDNHVDACGSHSMAIANVQAYLKSHDLDLGITVEVRNLVELHEVLNTGGITRIMLDNFEIPLLKEAVDTIQGRFETEASGGITLSNVRCYAETGVDFISVGALTHSSGTLDLSLKVV
ncbi:MAG: carboxylating nicotinate-nucleotide diphosphorylase [Saprospiraceae bacterium]|nr:carboxylating nicotinate-nucleotide diphosphorylase [Saprospiraceae bacterium]